jgi:hypothetical protein
MEKGNIILHRKKFNGSSYYHLEIEPVIKGTQYPLSLQLDENNNLFWGDSSTLIPNSIIKEVIETPQLEDYKPHFNLLAETTRDLFSVVSEQQERIDELSDKLNKIINFLK